MSPVKTIGAWVVLTFAVTFMSSIGMGQQAFAATTDNQQQVNSVPLEIEPVCSSESKLQSQWTVTNKNPENVTIDWNNFENNLTGAYVAPAGKSTMITGYNPADPNNTTRFTSLGQTSQTNATKVACNDEPEVPEVPETPACVDGYLHDNLFARYINSNTVSVSTKNGALLCDNVELYLSSYVMPRNYDGNGFAGNATAYPQTLSESVKITLPARTTGEGTYRVNFPDCENVQFDLYYAPEIKTVGENGHGTQNILSNIVLRDDKRCDGDVVVTPPTEPTTPTPEPTTPEVTPTPQQPTVPTTGNGNASGEMIKKSKPVSSPAPAGVTELPHTGASGTMPVMLIGMLLAVLVYGATYFAQPKRA